MSAERLMRSAEEAAVPFGVSMMTTCSSRETLGDDLEPVEPLVGDDERTGLDQVDRVGEEVTLVGRVDGAHDSTGLEDPEPDRQELLTVRQHHGHGFTVLEARLRRALAIWFDFLLIARS